MRWWAPAHPLVVMKHTKVSKAELLAVIDNIRRVVDADDSFEGNLEYTALSPEEPLERGEFMARGLWRVGNSMGQGGVRTLGDLGEDPTSRRLNQLAVAIAEITDWHDRNSPESLREIGKVLQRLGLDG